MTAQRRRHRLTPCSGGAWSSSVARLNPICQAPVTLDGCDCSGGGSTAERSRPPARRPWSIPGYSRAWRSGRPAAAFPFGRVRRHTPVAVALAAYDHRIAPLLVAALGRGPSGRRVVSIMTFFPPWSLLMVWANCPGSGRRLRTYARRVPGCLCSSACGHVPRSSPPPHRAPTAPALRDRGRGLSTGTGLVNIIAATRRRALPSLVHRRGGHVSSLAGLRPAWFVERRFFPSWRRTVRGWELGDGLGGPGPLRSGTPLGRIAGQRSRSAPRQPRAQGTGHARRSGGNDSHLRRRRRNVQGRWRGPAGQASAMTSVGLRPRGVHQQSVRPIWPQSARACTVLRGGGGQRCPIRSRTGGDIA